VAGEADHNQWVIYYGSQGVDPIPIKTGRSDDQIIADAIEAIRQPGTATVRHSRLDQQHGVRGCLA
jgi:hypothetical protein